MAFGLGVLRWSPAQFWAATPRELAAAAARYGAGPTPRPALEQLMDLFPDDHRRNA